MKKRKGFTLIEILVVIAIIVILLAILFPSFNHARNQAKTVICQSNLKQWGLIFSMYLNDNNDRFMRNESTKGWFYWMDILRVYHSNIHEICCCPMATKLYTDGGSIPFGAWCYKAENCIDYVATDNVKKGDFGSYGMNHWVCDLNQKDNRRPKEYFWRTPNNKGANNIPLFLDCATIGGDPIEINPPPNYPGELLPGDYDSTCMSRFCINRHYGNINCLFMDYSIRKVGLKQLWTLKWHKEYNTAGPWTQAGGVQPGDWPEWMKKFKDY